MEAFITKYWKYATLILGALLPIVATPVQAFIVAHPATYAAVAWIVAHLLPSPVPAAPVSK